MQHNHIMNNIELLQCSLCESGIKQINSTHARCSCSNYPVIKNILYLKRGIVAETSLTHLTRGEVTKAMYALMDSRRVANILSASPYPIPTSILFFLLEIIYFPQRHWWRYLKNRSRRITHLLALATISSIRPNHVIVDVGCGLGLFLQQAHLWHPTARLIGVDNSFFLLLLARRVLPSSVLLVCADIEMGLPLKNNVTNRMFFNDSIVPIAHKKLLFTHIHRALKKNGEAYLNHVHNTGGSLIEDHDGLSPQQMYTLTNHKLVLYTATDQNLYEGIISQHQLQYSRVKPLAPSYSYVLTRPRSSRVHRVTVAPIIHRHITRQQVDFTEDEHINAHHKNL